MTAPTARKRKRKKPKNFGRLGVAIDPVAEDDIDRPMNATDFKRARLRLGLSQVGMAKALGIEKYDGAGNGKINVSQIENGYMSITPAIQRLVRVALKFSAVRTYLRIDTLRLMFPPVGGARKINLALLLSDPPKGGISED